MEISVMQANTYSSSNFIPLIKTNLSTLKLKVKQNNNSKEDITITSRNNNNNNNNMPHYLLEINKTMIKLINNNITSSTKTNLSFMENYLMGTTLNGTTNGSDLIFNVSDNSELDYDYNIMNGTLDDTSWSMCKEWSAAQHGLFQTAHFFFAAAFLVPGSFKQSVLLVRALLSFGYFFLAIWGGIEVCAPDILLWNAIIVLLNCIHTALLTWRFLPPTLTLELTDLYVKIFKPLRVSKKHFKELVKEAKVMTLESGDIYAVEDISPADERLSILLKGRLRVTCDDTHLHFINQYQFVDSPEWEANHEQSDDVFQVTITAEEDSMYLCWSRMKLERVLRHRPMLKTVLESIIGKDITQKLYALNEHLSDLSDERNRNKSNELWVKTHNRSMSLDAVHTGTTGLVRSQAYKLAMKNANTFSPTSLGSIGKLQMNQQQQSWVPIVASQFPTTSPFLPHQNTFTSNTCVVAPVPIVTAATAATTVASVTTKPVSADLIPATPQRTRSLKGTKKEREVKFQSEK